MVAEPGYHLIPEPGVLAALWHCPVPSASPQVFDSHLPAMLEGRPLRVRLHCHHPSTGRVVEDVLETDPESSRRSCIALGSDVAPRSVACVASTYHATT